MNLDDMQLGQRVSLTREVSVYQLGTFPKGATGKITLLDIQDAPEGSQIAEILMDDHFPDLDDWGNTLQIFRHGDECSELTQLDLELQVGFT